MFDTIMVPVDGSKYSDKAIDYAIAIAEKFNSKIVAVHVLKEFSANSYDNEEDKGDDLLGKVTEKANNAGVSTIEHLITGDPLRDMATIVRKTRADLVIMHAFGSDTFDDDLNENQIGSVSERVIRTGNVPVLLIK
ncbi:MAG: universal stress protein [Methanobrevibacter sp.]|uniref:universal stress protein n=1 Tax=Methanobrevibacter sp. TaxID=66852 RepID=UPI0026DEC61C|nr:universal stress protein [Methanobrevibacter sp.]MDO5849390.1 universal stress protein [Methanobrevibacter sp.]